jgi:hypothetical protein
MKFAVVGFVAGMAAALPQGKPPAGNLVSTIAGLMDKNGLLDGGFAPKVRDEIVDSTPCGKIVLIFARASQEPANMVFEHSTDSFATRYSHICIGRLYGTLHLQRPEKGLRR